MGPQVSCLCGGRTRARAEGGSSGLMSGGGVGPV